MGRLDDITLEELHDLREQTEGEIPLERVLAAIGRKQGDELDTLAERHGVVEKTIRIYADRSRKRDHNAAVKHAGEWLLDRNVETVYVGDLTDVLATHWSADVNRRRTRSGRTAS